MIICGCFVNFHVEEILNTSLQFVYRSLKGEEVVKNIPVRALIHVEKQLEINPFHKLLKKEKKKRVRNITNVVVVNSKKKKCIS